MDHGNILEIENIRLLMRLRDAETKALHFEKYGPKPAQKPIPGPYDTPPTISTLNGLPAEILELVIQACDYSEDMDTLPKRVRAWGSLCQVNRKMRGAAINYLYRRAVFRDDADEMGRFLASAQVYQNIRSLVQEFVFDHRLPGPWSMAPIEAASTLPLFTNLKTLLLEDPDAYTLLSQLPWRYDLFPSLEKCVLSADRCTEAIPSPAGLTMLIVVRLWCSPNLKHLELEKSALNVHTPLLPNIPDREEAIDFVIIQVLSLDFPTNLAPVEYLGFSNCFFRLQDSVLKSLLDRRSVQCLSLRGSVVVPDTGLVNPLGPMQPVVPGMEMLADDLTELDYHIGRTGLDESVVYPNFMEATNLRKLTINLNNLGAFQDPDYEDAAQLQGVKRLAELPTTLESLTIEVFTWQINRFSFFRFVNQLVREREIGTTYLAQLHLRLVQTIEGKSAKSTEAKSLEWTSQQRSKAESAAHQTDPLGGSEELQELHSACKDAGVELTIEDVPEDSPKVRGYFREIFTWYSTPSPWHLIAPYHEA